MIRALSKRTFSLKKLKTYSLRSYFRKLRLWLSELFSGLLTKTISYKLKKNFAKFDTLKKKSYILGDLNINLYQNQNHTACKNSTLLSVTVFNDVKNYLRFCIMFGLTQITKSATRTTCSSTSLIDNILESLPDRISQEGVMNVGLSEHQLIYFTRKISRVKTGGVHKKIKFHSLKNYAVNASKNALR